ncbi:MAG: patatin-like phospholipase family protein [Steroidobacteraceae bacterium]
MIDRPTIASDHPRGRLAIVLSGGGARAAYQVGVLKAIATMHPGERPPWDVIVGTSAGGVCAAVLAAHADDWRGGIARLEEVWANFTVAQVFHADTRAMLRAGSRWLASALSGGRLAAAPQALFDNAPLRELLSARIDWQQIRRHLVEGKLHALALAATSYAGGHHRVFFDTAADVPDWRSAYRQGCRTTLTLNHLMASVAIPFLFPAVRIDGLHYGDGAMRQLAPLSPAIHLGADRLLVVGVRGLGAAGLADQASSDRPPSSGEIVGFMLDTLFSDQVESDLDHLQRTNRLLREAGRPLAGVRHIDAHRIVPSTDLRGIAEEHLGELPPALRRLLGAIGAQGPGGALLASYLLFESGYTRALIARGHADALAQRQMLQTLLT